MNARMLLRLLTALSLVTSLAACFFVPVGGDNYHHDGDDSHHGGEYHEAHDHD